MYKAKGVLEWLHEAQRGTSKDTSEVATFTVGICLIPREESLSLVFPGAKNQGAVSAWDKGV